MSIICVIMFQIYKTFLLRTNSRFRREGADGEARYVAGERNGLTLVKIL